MKYRVRGPYATALARIVLESGHELVDVSRQLSERFGIPQKTEIAPQATIKPSDEDPNTIIIVGYKDAVEEMLYELLSRIPFTYHEYRELGPYTTVIARVKGYEENECIVEIPGGEAILQSYKGCNAGETIIAHIVKPASGLNTKAVLLPGAAILKDTLVLLDDGLGKVYFSEHIKDFNRRASLQTIANQATRYGYSVRWRSSARSVPLEKALQDVEEAINSIEKIKKTKYREPMLLVHGESIAFIRLTRLSKEYLDDMRRKILPTTPYHHMLKTCNVDEDVVDLLDRMTKYIDRESLERAIKYYVIERLIGRTITIEHVKPDGKKIKIGPLDVINAIETELGEFLVCRRIIQSNGVYDGINVEKKSGDIAITLIPLNNWFIIHRYLDRSGREKGIYININTPPEICYNIYTIRYLDLLADVAIVGNNMRIVDLNELEKASSQGIIDQDLVYMAHETIKSIAMSIEAIRNALERAPP